MFCTSCGTEMADGFRYCSQCGAAIASHAEAAKRLSRPREDRKIAGVCAGVARYLGIDVTLVRVLMVVFTIWPPGVGLIFYVVCWFVMPNDPLALPPVGVQGNQVRA